MKREERHLQILDLLNESERLNVDSLAERFDVSVETIRRDLTVLSEQGMLRKVHGGAVRFQTAQENTMALRSQINRQAKETIGQYAAQFIDDGDSVFLSAGTTTAIFAEQSVNRLQGLTVITNCSSVAHTMWGNNETDHHVFLLGGVYNGVDTETSGPLLTNQLRLFQADHAVVSLGAINDTNGLMEYRVDAAEIVRVMMQQARQRTVLADYTKLDKAALVKIGELAEIDRLITDRPPSAALQQALDRAHVDLHVTGLVG